MLALGKWKLVPASICTGEWDHLMQIGPYSFASALYRGPPIAVPSSCDCVTLRNRLHKESHCVPELASHRLGTMRNMGI